MPAFRETSPPSSGKFTTKLRKSLNSISNAGLHAQMSDEASWETLLKASSSIRALVRPEPISGTPTRKQRSPLSRLIDRQIETRREQRWYYIALRRAVTHD